MISQKLTGILFFCIIICLTYSCTPVEILLHADLEGYVTNEMTDQPIEDVQISLTPSHDTVFTGNDGSFRIENLEPGNYEIHAAKIAYEESIKSITANSANTEYLEFKLNGIPTPEFSERYLDFGLGSSVNYFTISNIGNGKLEYFISTSKDWIKVSSTSGDATEETDRITVTIDRNGLSDDKHLETIKVYSLIGRDIKTDTVFVLLNGVMDNEYKFYTIRRIGTQVWMAENLNTGIKLDHLVNLLDNRVIEKYCYADIGSNCIIYGGLYTKSEMLKYGLTENEGIGTTQAVCPTGWHIPTDSEWMTLINFLGGELVAGIKLRETGDAHWIESPYSTNESGFTALPGGIINKGNGILCGCQDLGESGVWWSASTGYLSISSSAKVIFTSNASNNEIIIDDGNAGYSVRCVKNP